MGLSVLQVIFSIGSAIYQQNKIKKMKRRMAEAADKQKGFKFTLSGEAQDIPVVYGKQSIGGLTTSMKVTNSSEYGGDNSNIQFSEGLSVGYHSGNKNEFLHTNYVLAQEGINGVKWIRVDGVDYDKDSSKFQHNLRIHTSGGVADSVATSNGFPSTDTYTGVAHAHATFKLNRDEQNYHGPPDLQFLIEGQKVYSIDRSGTEGNYTYALSGSKTYSNNPAYCLLDYLMNTAYGRGLTLAEVDLESFYDAAQVCATIVRSNAKCPGKIHGTTEGQVRDIPLYECNMTVDTSTNFRDNIERIIATMGLAELVWSGRGQYRLHLDYPSDITETENLVVETFTDNDIVREEIGFSWPNASERYNQVTVRFDNEDEDFKNDSATWPKSYDTVYTTYLDEDNNQPLKSSVQGDGITDIYHATAYAEQIVRRSRNMMGVSLTLSKKALNLEPGDTIKIDSDLTAFNDVVRVEQVEVNSNFTVKVSGYRFSHDMLAWNMNDFISYGSRPSIDISVDAPSNITFEDDYANKSNLSLGRLSWDTGDNPTGYTYHVEASREGGDYKFVGETTASDFEITKLHDLQLSNTYRFRVRTRSHFGKYSIYTVSNYEVISSAAPAITSPSVNEEQYITNNASGLKNRVKISWNKGTGGLAAQSYFIEYKKRTETSYQALGSVTETEITIPDLSDGLYDFRITPKSYFNVLGNETDFATTIVGFSGDPADPTGFSGNINEGQINLTWDAPVDLDVLYGGYSQIRFHTAIDGSASWDTSSILVEKLSGNTTNKTVPTLKGTFFIRFYDAFDNFSVNPSTFVSTFIDGTFNAIDVIDEDTGGFAGTKTRCFVNGSGDLELSSNESHLIYDFANVVNLQEITTVRLVPSIFATVLQGGITVDSYANIASLDNFAGPLANAAIQIYVSTTEDDPTGSPTWSSYTLLTIGSYTARGLRFRLEIIADDSNVDVTVQNLDVTLDKKDIIKTGQSTSSSSNDTTVTFAEPFYGGTTTTDVPTIGTMAIGGAQGDTVVISARNKTSFSYSVYNSGARVIREVDWQAIGQ